MTEKILVVAPDLASAKASAEKANPATHWTIKVAEATDAPTAYVNSAKARGLNVYWVTRDRKPKAA